MVNPALVGGGLVLRRVHLGDGLAAVLPDVGLDLLSLLLQRPRLGLLLLRLLRLVAEAGHNGKVLVLQGDSV